MVHYDVMSFGKPAKNKAKLDPEKTLKLSFYIALIAAYCIWLVVTDYDIKSIDRPLYGWFTAY